MWVLLLATALSWAQTDSSSKEIPFDSAKLIYKTKTRQLGAFEILCEQRIISPTHEIIMSFRVNESKTPTKHNFLRFKTYNSCDSYKFKLSKNLQLMMVSSPGERTDEAGSTITVTYNWNPRTRQFEGETKVVYSPFKELQTQYRKILATAAIPKAEKLLIANRKKIEAYREIDPTQTQTVCEDFYNAYKTYGDNLYKQKDYKQAFDIYLSLRLKFGDPQNLFYNATSKTDKMILVCQTENANNDQSEDQFYTFAKRYLYKTEFIPFMLQRIHRSLKKNTEQSNELALQILKYLSFLLKSATHTEQLQYQLQIVGAWDKIVKNKTEHPYYDRLIEEDTHLILLLAENHSCSGIPQSVIDRISQKNDNREFLKGMTIATADDFYSQGLEKSAVFDYKQFVIGHVLLKKCSDIPKEVFERYFKFVQNQPYQS